MAYFAGRLSGRRTRLHGTADRQFLRDDGHCLAVHACRNGNHSRPLDSGAEAAGHLPPDQRRLPRGGGFADGLCAFVQLHAAERDVLHADDRAVQLGGLQRPRSGETRHRETLSADPRVGNRGIHRRDVVRRSDAYRRHPDQAHRLAALCFGVPVVRAGRLLLLAARMSRGPQRQVARGSTRWGCAHSRFSRRSVWPSSSSSRCCSAPLCR